MLRRVEGDRELLLDQAYLTIDTLANANGRLRTRAGLWLCTRPVAAGGEGDERKECERTKYHVSI